MLIVRALNPRPQAVRGATQRHHLQPSYRWLRWSITAGMLVALLALAGVGGHVASTVHVAHLTSSAAVPVVQRSFPPQPPCVGMPVPC